MGQDLILQDITIRHTPTVAFWKNLEKALDKKVDKMSDTELKGWADEIGMYSDSEDLRIEAHGVIKAALDDCRQPCRDVTWITLPIGGYDDNGLMLSVNKKSKKLYTVYLAGGMSGGDSLGETYEDFYKLNMLFAEYRYIDEVLEE